MAMSFSVKKMNRTRVSKRQHRQDCARRQIRGALQQWQDVRDAWLAAKSKNGNLKDSESVRQEMLLKLLLNDAGNELKLALHRANTA